MILRRLYLYLVSAAAMVLLAVGLVFLGATVLLFAFNDPSAESSRSQLAVFTAMTVVALPVWGVHFWVARRFAMRDPFERASALRRLYLYFVCLATALAAMETLAFALFFLFQPVFDQLPLNGLTAAQLGWASVVCVALLGFHFVIASRDRAAVGEEGASATLRRWYMYVALLVGLLTMLSSAAYLLQLGWTKLVLGSIVQYLYMATPAGSVIAGALLWSFHARAVATNHISDDRHSTLRALEGFIAVAFSIGAALFGATQILYYALDRALGVSNPGGAGTNLLAALAGPGSLLLVYGVAWFLIRRRLARDARTQEADRQAGVRRLYTNLAALISLGAMAYGAAVLLGDVNENVSATRLRAYSHVLDFFGGMFEIRNGKAVTPGGARSAAAWGEMVGASPDQGTAFFDKLLAKDDGWMASLYDALARIHGPVRDYLTEPARLKRFYSAVRGRITSPGPGRPVFRSNTDMMLFTTRLRLDANGKPHIPGGLEVW